MHLQIEKIWPRFPTFSLRSFLPRRLLVKRFPDLKVVLIHGIWPPSCLQDDGSIRIPEAVVEGVRNYNVVLELLTGLQHRSDLYGPGDVVLKAFYDTFGPAKPMWGSEYTHVNLPDRRAVPAPVRLHQGAVPVHERKRRRPDPGWDRHGDVWHPNLSLTVTW